MESGKGGGPGNQVRTHVSHGRGELRKGTPVFSAVARQLHLSSGELERFVSCPLSREEYLEVLRDRQVI